LAALAPARRQSRIRKVSLATPLAAVTTG